MTLKHILRNSLATGLLTASALTSLAQPSGQWDFNTGNLNATVGSALTYRDGVGNNTATNTVFGTTTALGLPLINGAVATVMGFPASTNGMGYVMAGPNSGDSGSLQNNYTLVLDVLYPSASTGKTRGILDADKGVIQGVANTAELFVSSGNGVGSRTFHGTIAANTWYRIGFVVDGAAGQIRKYVDGLEVGTEAITTLDRWALDAPGTSILFNDEKGNAAAGFVNSVQLRPTALNAGQMLALGAATAAGVPQVIPPVPSYIFTRSPGVSVTGVAPIPTITAALKNGDTVISQPSIQLWFDGGVVTPTVGVVADGFDISYATTNILAPGSLHAAALVWSDNVAGVSSNRWTFTVGQYQSVTLPPPLFFEDFESTSEGAVPAGWTLTNLTTSLTAGFDLNNFTSDSYKDFVVVSSNLLYSLDTRRFNRNPIVLNGSLLNGLIRGNTLYGESDNRGGSQVQVAYSPDYNLTGKSNIFLGFFSSYEQNQDSLGAVEYSIDQGANWLPLTYLLDDEGGVADVKRTNGVVDVAATMNTVDAGAAYATNYGAFVLAPISSIKPANISGRINDDSFESKRIEVLRVPSGDGRATVRFRFLQTGTGSWYWSLDDIGVYSINTPVLTTQPASQKIDVGSPVTFTVAATINPPYTYQWQFNGANILNATNATYTIASVETNNAGAYSVLVKNSDGTTPSAQATLTVVSVPEITTQPASRLSSPGWPVMISVAARGRQPLTVQWLRNGTALGGATGSNLFYPSVQSSDSGAISVIVGNTSGSVTSSVVSLGVFSGAITNDMVAYMKFDGNTADSSGRGNNATAVGAPGFVAGKVGSGALQITTVQNGSSFNYATFGAATPADLGFGATNDFTVALWAFIPTNSFKGDPALLGNKDWGSGSNPGFVIFTTGGLRWNYRDLNGTRTDYNPGIRVDDGSWHHLLVVFARTNGARTYLDGVLRDTRSIGNGAGSIDAAAGKTFNIGQDGTGTYTDGNGVGITNAVLDEVVIWRRALTQQEATAVYAVGQAGLEVTRAVAIAAGSITAVPSGSNISMSWTGASGLKLQSTTSLAAPIVWSDVPNTDGVSNIVLPATGAPTFYRLSR